MPDCPDLIKVVSAGPAYSRAAVTLSAAGVDLATADTSACQGLVDRGRYETFDPFGAAFFGGEVAYREHVFNQRSLLHMGASS